MGRREKLDNSNPFANNLHGIAAAILEGEPERALAVREDGAIEAGRFTLTATGMVIDPHATFDEWREIGDVLRRIDSSIQWLLGDWMAYAERQWGKTYEQVAEATGYNAKTLRNFAWVAWNVDSSLRRDTLSFEHHKIVAHLSPDAQEHFLSQAAAGNWSTRRLQNEIAPPTLPSKNDTPPAPGTREFTTLLRQTMRKAGQGDRDARERARELAWDIIRWLDAGDGR